MFRFSSNPAAVRTCDADVVLVGIEYSSQFGRNAEYLVSGLMAVRFIPVGSVSLFQNLMKITKRLDRKIQQENVGGVAFVPLTGEYGHKF